MEATAAYLLPSLLVLPFFDPSLFLPLSIPLFPVSGWGRIINIASVHGLVGSALKAPYVASKHGIVGLTKAGDTNYT